MNNNSKEQMTRDIICKSHSARTERELYRICPSKLSKGELEDLYFALLENNLDLKRTINSQREKIKELSTKLQRMSASQRSSFSKEQRECCLTIKAAYNEQKESVADLKRTNERMTERIKLLNMRLCSAKQFLKRSPGQATPCCAKCFLGVVSTPKSLSVTTLNTKASDSNIKTKAISTQTIDKDEKTLLAAKTNGNKSEDDATPLKMDLNTLEERVCEENKCRTVMEELKEKIVNLQLELSHCHEEYRERIGRLKGEVSTLQGDKNPTNMLKEHSVRTDHLTTRLREADTNNRELVAQLAIERRKVAEIEMRLKAAQISARVVDTIKQHLTKADVENKNSPLPLQTVKPSTIEGNNLLKTLNKNEAIEQFGDQSPDSKRVGYIVFKTEANHDGQAKNLDDSGYADGTKSNDIEDNKITSGSQNQELMRKIEHLQAQFENIKMPNAPVSLIPETSQESYHCYGINIKETGTSHPKKCVEINETQPNTISIHRHLTESSQDMTIDLMTQNGNKDDSLPTILQHASLQKHCINTEIPHKSWDNTWGQYPVVLPSTSRGFTEDANTFTGMYSASEQNVRDVTSIADRDTYENINDKYQIIEPLISKEQNFDKEHKKSNIMQQSCAKNKNAHVELRTIDETQSQNDLTSEDHDIKYSKVKRLSFENEQAKLDFAKNTPGLLAPSIESFSLVGNNVLKTDSIEMNRRRLTRDPTDRTAASLKGSKNGKTEAVDSAVVKNYFITDYDTEIGNGRTGRALESEQDGEGKYSEGTMTSGLRPLLTNRGPVISEKQSAGLMFLDTNNTTDNLKLGSVAHRDNKIIGNTDEINTLQNLKGPNKFGIQVTPRTVEQYAPYRRSTVNPHTHTYTVKHSDGDKSKDNDRDTDCEISELTDLPTELDETSPREYLSPGEDKGTCTLSESRTGATVDLGSLSEGELPGLTTIPRRLSESERPADDNSQNGHHRTSAQKMESALQAITAELAKCKQLLLHQRRQSREGTKKLLDVEVMTDSCPTLIGLKRAPANQKIVQTYTPKCIFTLHIGTVVLSDEAVMNSRHMSLVLTWKFYDQSVTMTRMRTNRVVLFDFSTEYDILVTDEFLDYMKHEEMPIMICQSDKYDEPFAICSLPLREPLLHTNRRADISLALCAGPQMHRALGVDAIDGSDEVGVLDLWCMLRADSRLLPIINRSMLKKSPSHPVNISNGQTVNANFSGSQIMEQILDENPSNGYRLSQEFDLNLGERHQHSSIERPVKHAWKQQPFDEQRTTKKGKRKKFRNMSLIRHKENPRGEQEFITAHEKNDFHTVERYGVSYEANEFDRGKKAVTIRQQSIDNVCDEPQKDIKNEDDDSKDETLDITILWLALNEESNIMTDPDIQRLYIAYSFLGRSGADLETPLSLPKPKNNVEKCHFNFKKTFQLHEPDLPVLGHMARCKRLLVRDHDLAECIVFQVVSEPPEDPLGLARCEDIGEARVYLGDILSCSGNGNFYTEVVPVLGVRGGTGGRRVRVGSEGSRARRWSGESHEGRVAIGVLAVRVDGLHVVRRCLYRSQSHRDLTKLR